MKNAWDTKTDEDNIFFFVWSGDHVQITSIADLLYFRLELLSQSYRHERK